MTLIEALLSFLIGLAANGITSEILLARQRTLDEALQDADALRIALRSRVPLSDEVGLACIELARNRDRLGITREEAPLWSLLTDDIFQRDVVEWLRAGGIEEGKGAKSRLVTSMTAALSRTAHLKSASSS